MQEMRWKIAMLPRLQVDTLVACFLLQHFGEEKFPGIKDAEYLFWIDIPDNTTAEALERERYILLDMGGGKFDHHGTRNDAVEKCVSQMVAEHLGIHTKASVKKLLEYARRDDIEGRGTLSKDPIDRAFGLSGLVNNLNRMLPDEQEAILKIVMPLFIAHHAEEKKRHEDFPAEYAEKLRNGKAAAFRIASVRGPINLVVIETDEIGMAGYLRARADIAADIVLQKLSSGHVNVVTQQKKMLELGEIARRLREAEAERKGLKGKLAGVDLAHPGRVEGLEEWYFDTRARTIQNGGIRPQWTPATRLSLGDIVTIVKEASAVKL